MRLQPLPSGAFHNPFFPGLGTDARTGALSQFMTRPVIQFDRHQDAEAKITTSGSFHETFGPKRPASGLFQNPVTRRDLTTPCEDDRTRPMRVNDVPEGLIIAKASSGPGTHPAITIIQLTEVEVSVQPETWRARSATRRFRVKPPGYHFPSLPPMQVVVEGMRGMG
ncbi:hypothetical protein N7453_009136 [Penicillium expansum]|nr:hypothetical protein N7453_009136 [Penicillium expansum]